MPETPLKASANKASGTEWYLPAIAGPFGPSPIKGLDRQPSRSKAITAAKRWIKEQKES